MSVEDEIEIIEVSADDIEEIEEGDIGDEGVQMEAAGKPGSLRRAFVTTFARFVGKYAPFLLQQCRFGAMHWAWNRLCACGYGTLIEAIDAENPATGWHGGLLDMDLGSELQPCAHCFPEHSKNHQQWALTDEESHIVDAWRIYRSEVLDSFDDKTSFKYEINVKLGNGPSTFLLSRTQGLEGLGGTKGLFSGVQREPKSSKPN